MSDEKDTSTGSKIKKALGMESDDLSAAEALGVKKRTPREELTPEQRKKRDDDDNSTSAAIF